MKGERAGPSQVRSRLLGVIEDMPGITPSEIIERTGLNEGTVRYHLDMMERKGEINFRTAGKRRECFPSTLCDKVEGNGRVGHSLTHKRVLDVVRAMPGCTRTELLGRVRTRGPELIRVLKALEERGLIVKEVRDGDERYSPLSERRMLDEVMLELIDRYLEGTIDLERFQRMKEEVRRRRSEL